MIFHKNIRAHNLRVRYLMLSWLRRHLKMYIYVHLYPVTHKCFRMIPIHPWYGIKVTPTVPPFSVFPLKVRSVLSPSITLSAPLKMYFILLEANACSISRLADGFSHDAIRSASKTPLSNCIYFCSSEESPSRMPCTHQSSAYTTIPVGSVKRRGLAAQWV